MTQAKNQQPTPQNQPPTTQPPPTPPSNQPIKPPKKPQNNKTLRITLISLASLAIFTLIAFIVWYFFIRSTIKSGPPASSSIINTQTTPITPNSTNDWKTFTDTKCKYQIKHPQSWYIYDQAQDEETNTILLSSKPITTQTINQDQSKITIGCNSTNPDLTNQQVAQLLAQRFDSYSSSNLNQTTINNQSAYQYINNSESLTEYYFFPQDSSVIIVNITPIQNTQDQQVSQILSSFKLL